MTRHFLDLKDVSATDLRTILDGAKTIKAARRAGSEKRPLAGKTLGYDLREALHPDTRLL